MRWRKHNLPLRREIRDFLASLPNIYDSSGQKAFITSAGLDPAVENQLHFGVPVAQFVQHVSRSKILKKGLESFIVFPVFLIR